MRTSTVILAAAMALLLLATAARSDDGGDCGKEDATAAGSESRARARTLKIAAFFSILVCGALGCGLPVLGRRVPALRPDAKTREAMTDLSLKLVYNASYLERQIIFMELNCK
uniref:Uncharacterized protein n=1 Tax=Leersia perrieri TaxID=77586 RepID=A0A0D9WX12_9ORYZ